MPIQKVTSGIIADGAISVTDIADATITGTKLAANTITGDVIGQNAISSNNIVNATITGTKLAANSVNSTIIAANTISNTNIQTGAIESYISAAGLSFGMRNRIINGAMVIDQRNAGASVTVNSASYAYGVDRFFAQGQSADGVFAVQRSTTAPAGFVNSLLATVTTADTSLGATQVYQIVQPIEGYNVADLGWGAVGAATVTLSFWVRSSVTGVFGGSLFNATAARSYPFTYTINSANTFEQKTITISGDTTGTWGTGNGVGIYVIFSLGCGSTISGTAGSWAGAQYNSATGATNLMATNGATFYITGVQLEKGSTATSFDYRPIGTELALCQRYYEKGWFWAEGATNGGSQNVRSFQFSVQKRAAPTLSNGNVSGPNANISSSNIEIGYNEYDPSYPQNGSLTAACFRWVSSGSNATLRQFWVASSEL
jgi:hypothetical protein